VAKACLLGEIGKKWQDTTGRQQIVGKLSGPAGGESTPDPVLQFLEWLQKLATNLMMSSERLGGAVRQGLGFFRLT
jgi:hypothetical protein